MTNPLKCDIIQIVVLQIVVLQIVVLQIVVLHFLYVVLLIKRADFPGCECLELLCKKIRGGFYKDHEKTCNDFIGRNCGCRDG